MQVSDPPPRRDVDLWTVEPWVRMALRCQHQRAQYTVSRSRFADQELGRRLPGLAVVRDLLRSRE